MSRVESKVKTYHLMILDKSGSMETVRDVTISGLNEQLQSIRKSAKDFDNQEQIVCFSTFSNEVDISSVWNKEISKIEDFTRETYNPTGFTALLDAIGVSVNKLKEEIKAELAERKANVILTIFTDGQENSSHQYNWADIKGLIKSIRESGQWTVAFIGCGENVFDVADQMGIEKGNTLRYQAGEEGTQNAFRSMSVARSRRTESYSDSLDKGLIDTSGINDSMSFFDESGKD